MNKHVFEVAEEIKPNTITHSKESLCGDVEKANDCFQKYMTVICTAFADGYGVSLSQRLISDDDNAVQVIGAFFLLLYEEQRALAMLKKLRKTGHLEVRTTAETIINEWEKGTLKFPKLIDGKIVYV